MPPTVDHSFAKMVAIKRLITGTLSICAGIGLIAYVVTRDMPLAPPFFLALLIFFAGGGWTLWDGLRLRRELRSS